MGYLKMFTFLCVVLICIITFGGGCNGDIDSIVAPMEKSEQEALFSAIQGFVGKWWNGSDLYPDPCGWTPIQGVSCDLYGEFWYVTSLNIGPVHENSLKCAPNIDFSMNLFKLKHLKSLSIFNCFDDPLHPISIPTDNWGALAGNLESLEFRSNRGLIGQIPYAFGGLTKLQSLVIIENGLTGEIPSNLGSLVNLKRLVIAQDRITGSIPGSLGLLRSLLILDLSMNSLSGHLSLSFGGLTSLLKLDLSKNLLEGMIPYQIGNLKNLTLLDLSNNKLSGGLSNAFQEMSSLKELVLSGNPFGGNMMSMNWQYMKGLIILDMSNTRLTGGIPNSIAELKRLRFLGLNDNNLVGEIPPKLATLPNISAIYLNGNNLTGELKFPKEFYGKMQGKFGAWNNTNLCLPIDSMPSSHVPFGVKQCQKEKVLNGRDLHQNTHLDDGNLSHSSMSMASLGLTNYVSKELWCLLIFVELVFRGLIT